MKKGKIILYCMLIAGIIGFGILINYESKVHIEDSSDFNSFLQENVTKEKRITVYINTSDMKYNEEEYICKYEFHYERDSGMKELIFRDLSTSEYSLWYKNNQGYYDLFNYDSENDEWVHSALSNEPASLEIDTIFKDVSMYELVEEKSSYNDSECYTLEKTENLEDGSEVHYVLLVDTKKLLPVYMATMVLKPVDADVQVNDNVMISGEQYDSIVTTYELVYDSKQLPFAVDYGKVRENINEK